MNRQPLSRRPLPESRVRALAALLLLLLLSACSALADEFTWLDVAPPSPPHAGQPPSDHLRDRQ